jgi:hypothetical protein
MMLLSPFAHYQLRKLLPNLICFSFVLADQVKLSSSINLDKVLHHSLHRLQKSPNSIIKIKELEVLVVMYQNIAERKSKTHSSLLEIKRRILSLLELNQPLSDGVKLPPMISEQSTGLFKFHFSGRLHQGYNHNNQLYGLIREFPVTCKLQSYRLMWVLIDQKLACLCTFSQAHHRIWISLQSPACATLLQQEQVIESLQSLHLRSYKLRRVTA